MEEPVKYFNKKHTEDEILSIANEACSLVIGSEKLYEAVDGAKNFIISKVVDKYHKMPDEERDKLREFLCSSIDVDVLCDTNPSFMADIGKVAKK